MAVIVKPPVSTGYLDYVLPRNPVTKEREFRLVPEAVELALGSYLYSGMISSEGGYYSKHNYQGLIEKVGKRIAPHTDRPELPFQYTVIDSSQLNAWCLPAGKVAFYRGIIERMEHEKDTFGVGHFSLEEKIAAVMGHEVTHACARHSARNLEFVAFLYAVVATLQYALSIFIANTEEDLKKEKPNQLKARPLNDSQNQLALAKTVDVIFTHSYGIILKLLQTHGSRQKEFEADKYGMVYLQRAGYNPKVALWLQKFLEKQRPSDDSFFESIMHLFASHPSSKERYEENCKTLEQIKKGQLK